jgi:hypothetical protein
VWPGAWLKFWLSRYWVLALALALATVLALVGGSIFPVLGGLVFAVLGNAVYDRLLGARWKVPDLYGNHGLR